MSGKAATLRDSLGNGKADADNGALPGLVLIFSMGEAACTLFPLENGNIELGRGDGNTPCPADPKMSRRHATVTYNGECFLITDHDSQNGTFLDGVRITKNCSTANALVLRTGDSLFLLGADLRPLLQGGIKRQVDRILGPALQKVHAQAERASQFGRTLHITGESGSGKEGVAHAFHAASPHSRGPFVAINCATIAKGVAERVLFGARRGAFSGAVADTEGLIQSADGGTLFLDEVAELDLAVQAKLLRVLETNEVLPIGGLRARQVNLQLCSASHRDLRQEVSVGHFREDLYYRINSPEVTIPPLRQRLVEIPWLVAEALRPFAPLGVHSTFLEACLLRPWPGNVRELLSAVRAAAQDALGRKDQKLLPQHLPKNAGQALERAAAPAVACAMVWQPPIAHGRQAPKELPDRTRIEEVLQRTGGNISAAARLLGLHRTQLKRLFDKLGIHVGRSDFDLDHEDD